MKVLQLLSTSIGSKILVACTGLALVGFLVFHLVGNLLLFVGPAAFNEHAHALISNPLVVPAELGLIAIFLLHIVTAVRHVVHGRTARPRRYTVRKWAGGPSRKTIGSSTMILTGLVMLVFVVLHLGTFKYGPYYTTSVPGERDLYTLMVEVFRDPFYAGFYVACMVIVGLHLRHGISSSLQSLGLMPHSWAGRLLRAGAATAVVVAGLFALVPIYVYLPMTLDAKVPSGPLADKWDHHKFASKLVNPANRRRHTVIIVGTGLAGASAASSLGELGYNVLAFCIHDSPRRAHSIAAQGGINAAKNYQNDGDSTWRLFYDTIKGGDYRAREANVYRLAQTSANIIDQCVAQGVPFAREYGGQLDNRSFGGAQVSRTFYARGQTGQQLLLGAYQSMMRQVERGNVKLFAQREMLDLVVVNGRARGILCRNLVTGQIERHVADAVCLATGGYGTAYYLSTSAVNSNVTGAWRAHKRGALFANPCFTQIHPTCIPVSGEHQSKLTLMSESLRNDGRVWVPKTQGDKRHPRDIPESERDYYLERKYPSFGNLVPRDVASRNAKSVCDDGRGVGDSGLAVYLDFKAAIDRLGRDTIAGRYGNLFEMYTKITDEDPYVEPMRMYPAVHYTMGGLWVDYNLMSNVPGLHVLGEANFSDHGANRLGASALMQGLADGYFVIPYTLAHYIASTTLDAVTTAHDAFDEAEASVRGRMDQILGIKGRETPRALHRRLGQIMWDEAGMARNAAGLTRALDLIPKLRDEFWQNVSVPGEQTHLNKNLEYAGRVADYLEFTELLVRDALHRTESCGGHFREESQTPEGEALRDDDQFTYVAAWEFTGVGSSPVLHKEPLAFENVKPSQRSYK